MFQTCRTQVYLILEAIVVILGENYGHMLSKPL